MAEPGTPLLSITIPTYNRARYLKMALEQLHKESVGLLDQLEFIVSDNASTDDTPAVVQAAMDQGLPVQYLRNPVDIGGDENFAQCFNVARGNYVVLLSDDDLFVDGALARLLQALAAAQYGVVCLRPYGYLNDFRQEYPAGLPWSGPWRQREFDDANDFLRAIGPLVTLISACVINKRLLPGVDARDFCGANFVQVHLAVRAALRAQRNLYVNQYQLACKRNNSGGYDLSQVFVRNLGGVFDSCIPLGLSQSAIRAIEQRFLLGFFPYYLLRVRLANRGDMASMDAVFKHRFHDRVLYWLWIAPILSWPRPLALLWGGVATLIGRLLSGDFRRGVAFTWNRLLGAA